MTDEQDDRRVRRTKQSLQNALLSLIAEKSFDKITVQEILERANVGRTTFYAHFQGKEDLFLSSHDSIIGTIACSFVSDEGVLRAEPSPELIAFLQGMSHPSREVYFYLTWGSDTGEILRLLKERIAERLAVRLHEVYREERHSIPFVVVAQHIASSIVSLSSWWLDKRIPFSAQELATMIHQLNRVALESALGTAERKLPLE